eukprot:3905582-Rhodomonas_salina.1
MPSEAARHTRREQTNIITFDTSVSQSNSAGVSCRTVGVGFQGWKRGGAGGAGGGGHLPTK